MRIDCPKCGAKLAAWEDNNETRFCGKCEQEFAQSQEDFEEAQRAELKKKCAACNAKMGGECDWGWECPTARALSSVARAF